ncbi:hypothetical protein [Geotalea sp. SG265]|uniref:hypothetical protein n=1 Tax=Geotalea sp. SG265 TaxID=2922867 RepID=UPI001FAF0ADB|nr:hypothetical protein [Geotalea sp. SG265]
MKKKNLLALLSLTAVVTATTATALAFTAPGGGVYGSKHDINAYAKIYNGVPSAISGDEQERTCAFCHTPHHAFDPAANNADYLPLWSHDLTEKNYTPYISDTLQAAIGDPLIGPSRLCMSCHDGVVAIDTHYRKSTDTLNPAQLTGDIFSDSDAEHGAVGAGDSLIGDHPIGFNYLDAMNADKAAGNKLAQGIRDISTPFNGNPAGVTIKDTLHLGTTMTCATCHDVHNKDNVASKTGSALDNTGGTETGFNYFVYAPQQRSQLCTTCHNK